MNFLPDVPIPERVRTGSVSTLQSFGDYQAAWNECHTDFNAYWLNVAKAKVVWRKAPTQGCVGSFDTVRHAPLTWFADGKLNVTETCIDQHVATNPTKLALLWEADTLGTGGAMTYSELLVAVSRAASGLRSLGVQKGDRVIVYMGMVPEAVIAMLACARIGAVHSVVFGGFSSEAIRSRVADCGANWVITQDVGIRGGRQIPLKDTVDAALRENATVRKVVVFQREPGARTGWVAGRDVSWDELIEGQPDFFPATEMDAEDPLFILYTSGSTGKPKGVVHTCGGYLVYTASTHATVFDLRPEDIYACVADVGWITGHSYIVYGPLANGATTLVFESIPTYPDPGRYWSLVERHRVTIFYTAPTAIRALAAFGEEVPAQYDLSSLRVLGTVGEPINPEAWHWYHQAVGKGRCTVVDTWWQTETGGICISSIAHITPPVPGAATYPLPGIVPALLDDFGTLRSEAGEGLLVLTQPWPGQARTVWGDHARFYETYFSRFPGNYFTGDGAIRDEAGRYKITGRVDDVLNVSGHRMGTAEFESELVRHTAVAEAAVVGFPHAIKGEGVCAYLVLRGDVADSPALRDALQGQCRGGIGAHAKVDRFIVVPGLPKTRSGKVMRRILRKVACGEGHELGDVSTLADSAVVDAIIVAANKES